MTKYRRPVLYGEIAIRLRNLIRETCRAMDAKIIKGHVSDDHLRLLVSVPAHVSVSKFLQRLKGKHPASCWANIGNWHSNSGDGISRVVAASSQVVGT
ncbi:MAG: IS200/IS605 family transposase [Desulfomonilaceae bacterium]